MSSGWIITPDHSSGWSWCWMHLSCYGSHLSTLRAEVGQDMAYHIYQVENIETPSCSSYVLSRWVVTPFGHYKYSWLLITVHAEPHVSSTYLVMALSTHAGNPDGLCWSGQGLPHSWGWKHNNTIFFVFCNSSTLSRWVVKPFGRYKYFFYFLPLILMRSFSLW